MLITVQRGISIRGATWLLLAALLVLAPPSTAPDAAGRLFGREWDAVMARTRAEEQDCVSANGPGCSLAELRDLIDGLRGAPVMRRLHEVNRAVNRAAYREDPTNWGRRDHWSTPHELLTRGGDCEDFAIAKYLALRGLGFPARDLRLLILYDTRRQRAHAVLAVELDGRELVLDNLGGAILPLSALPHYRVRYALNERGVAVRR